MKITLEIEISEVSMLDHAAEDAADLLTELSDRIIAGDEFSKGESIVYKNSTSGGRVLLQFDQAEMNELIDGTCDVCYMLDCMCDDDECDGDEEED